eukprot:11989542-Alexandrium_andersonii.AAC.1
MCACKLQLFCLQTVPVLWWCFVTCQRGAMTPRSAAVEHSKDQERDKPEGEKTKRVLEVKLRPRPLPGTKGDGGKDGGGKGDGVGGGGGENLMQGIEAKKPRTKCFPVLRKFSQ